VVIPALGFGPIGSESTASVRHLPCALPMARSDQDDLCTITPPVNDAMALYASHSFATDEAYQVSHRRNSGSICVLNGD
jgi:hypothetical protein